MGSKTIFRFGVRQKVILALLTVLFLSLSISGFITIREIQERVHQQEVDRARAVAQYMATSVSYGVIGYDYHTLQMLADEIINTKEDVIFVEITNTSRGTVMAKAGTRPGYDEEDIIEIKTDITFGEDEKAKIGELHMIIDMGGSMEQIEFQTWVVIQREGIILLVIGLCEFIALSFFIIRPIGMIADAINEKTDHKDLLKKDIPVYTNDEFGDVARGFKALSKDLYDAYRLLHTKVDFANDELKQANDRLKEANAELIHKSEELQHVNDELVKLSFTDPLTGTYNRRYFEEIIDTEIAMSLRHNETNSVLLMDIDHFKRINDTYGHPAGDMVLKQFADIVKGVVRKTDAVCRLGGEEFVILTRRTTIETCLLIANKIRQVVAAMPFDTDTEKQINITVSIGIATFPDKHSTSTADSLIASADKALYWCKQNGRNMVVHFNDIRDNIEEDPII